MSTAPLQRLAARSHPSGNSSHTSLVLRRKCACGSPTSSLTGECADCKSKKLLQTKRRIGASNDPQEREADRVADQVIGNGLPASPLVSSPASGLLQRQEAPKEKTNQEKYQEGLEKLGDAFLKTPLGKEIQEKIKQDALVKGATALGKDFISTWPGKIVTGAAATGAVAALAATHKELPAQIPEIPLDILTPGLSVQLTYKGPVDKPTEAMITFKFTEQAPKASGDRKPLSASEKYRAETARLAAENAKFRAGMTYQPGSLEDLQQKFEQEAIRKAVLKSSGGPDIEGSIKKYPWLAAPQPKGGLQLTMPKPSFGVQPSSPFGDQFKLKLLGEQKKKPDDEPELQKKLSVGASNDPLEQEADRVADQVLASSAPSAASGAPLRIQRFTAQTTGQGGPAPTSVDRVLSSPGNPLEPALRQDMERRFVHDFSTVRVHTGQAAEQSAQDVSARAYTVGKHIVFGQGQLQPEGHQGRHLIAHELAHVLQQGDDDEQIQRDGMGDLRLSEACEETKGKIRLDPAYLALDPNSKKLAEEIIVESEKRLLGERYKLLVALEALFTSKPKPPATISVETKSSTAVAATQEQTRLEKPVAAKNTGIEEQGSRDPRRAAAWTPIKGKFGGGTYYVDRRSATDIHIKASIFLHPTGTGTPADVAQIKGMEDAIEKAASTKGYIVDITFVTTKDADTFEIEVDPSRWEVATNWSGGEPLGFAHELHHMFAFELDRYNYIDAHSTNASMQIDQRLIWFRKELGKPANFNDPTSIMDQAPHPNDRDVCAVAGLDMATCLAARQKIAKKP